MSLLNLEKQGRPGRVRGYIRVPRFEGHTLCPVEVLRTYLSKVSFYAVIMFT